MSAQETIREMLHREPFEPFRVVSSGGTTYTIRNPELVALMKSRLFIAESNSDRCTYVPWLHVAAVEVLANGHPRTARRKRRE